MSPREQHEKFMSSMKHYVDIAMGMLYIILTMFMYRMPGLGEQFGKDFVLILLGIFFCYGLYRTLRGVWALYKVMKRKGHS